MLGSLVAHIAIGFSLSQLARLGVLLLCWLLTTADGCIHVCREEERWRRYAEHYYNSTAGGQA